MKRSAGEGKSLFLLFFNVLLCVLDKRSLFWKINHTVGFFEERRAAVPIKGERTKERITRAAAELFRRQGFAACSTHGRTPCASRFVQLVTKLSRPFASSVITERNSAFDSVQ